MPQRPANGVAAPTVDVIVIGAGVAGLQAAGQLLRLGYDVLVVEARPRAGGRIDTRRPPGWPGPVEAGPEFVHGRPAELVRALAAAGARIREHPGRHHTARAGAIRAAGAGWQAAFRLLDRLPNEDIAFDAALRRRALRRAAPAGIRAILRAYVEGFNAADARRVSVRSLLRQAEAEEAEGADRAFRVVDGFDRLVAHLATPLLPASAGHADSAGVAGWRLRLSTVVTDVRWHARDGLVQVRWRAGHGGARGAARARAVLVTLPLGVLKQPPSTPGAVRFVPALPGAKRAAIQRLQMGNVVKVILRFRAPVHAGVLAALPADLSFLHTAPGPVPTWWVPRPLPANQLVGWIAGPAADRFVRRYADPLRAAAAGLARAIGQRPASLLAELEDARVIDWAGDPFARGAYSWVSAGAIAAPAALGLPLGGRLFFAGEATDTAGDPGTVHGAMATGRRAADEIARALR